MTGRHSDTGRDGQDELDFSLMFLQPRRERGTSGNNPKRKNTARGGNRGAQPARRRPSAAPARHRRLRRRRITRLLLWAAALLAVICLVMAAGRLLGGIRAASRMEREDLPEILAQSVGGLSTQDIPQEIYDRHPQWTEDYLTVSEYARPGTPLGRVKNIFVHYTANPGTSASQNRSYFEQLKDTHERAASAHFIIGYEGEILLVVPLEEMAYAVKTRNEDSISVECCYKAKDGQFTQETYDSLIDLLAWLLEAYDLSPEDILRHYDCGGKKCPLYYVDHEDAWRILKQDVSQRLSR